MASTQPPTHPFEVVTSTPCQNRCSLLTKQKDVALAELFFPPHLKNILFVLMIYLIFLVEKFSVFSFGFSFLFDVVLRETIFLVVFGRFLVGLMKRLMQWHGKFAVHIFLSVWFFLSLFPNVFPTTTQHLHDVCRKSVGELGLKERSVSLSKGQRLFFSFDKWKLC